MPGAGIDAGAKIRKASGVGAEIRKASGVGAEM